MFSAFYIWHGIFLNDLKNITFPIFIFFGLGALVYLVISYVLFRIFEAKLFNKLFEAPILRGIMSGASLGFILFSLITVLGISFTNRLNLTYLIADFAWQIIEQVIGGFIIALGKIIIFEHDHSAIRD